MKAPPRSCPTTTGSFSSHHEPMTATAVCAARIAAVRGAPSEGGGVYMAAARGRVGAPGGSGSPHDHPWGARAPPKNGGGANVDAATPAETIAAAPSDTLL